MKSTALSQLLRFSTALSTVALPTMLAAQTTTPAATSADAPAPAQEIVVTGSRIARP